MTELRSIFHDIMLYNDTSLSRMQEADGEKVGLYMGRGGVVHWE